MSAGVAIGLALAAVCALGTNAGWLIKHRGAQESPRMRHRRPLSSVRALFASRWFAVGLIVASAAGLLHIAALALAPISIVQAVMAGGIVILAVLGERVFALRVLPRQWWGVVLAAIGLSLLGFSLPPIRGAHTHFSGEVMLLFDALLLGGSVLLLGCSRLRRLAAYDGVLIGAAGGLFFGISDVGVKALVGVAHGGALALLGSLWLAVVLASGVLAQYVSARSLQSGDAISVTALTGLAVNVANIVGGIVVFGDPLAGGWPSSIVEVLAFALICAGALLTPVPAVARTRLVDAANVELGLVSPRDRIARERAGAPVV
jgi:drug/metabolite transporter (DMT)-like permease